MNTRLTNSLPSRLAGSLGLAVVLLLLVTALAAKERPNVVLFAVDDLCDRVGAMGYEQAVTPNMDRLANRGVVV